MTPSIHVDPSTEPRRSLRGEALGLLPWLLLSFAAAAAGGLASAGAPEFYAGLTRPAWAPPGWLFGPVWTALYLAMAVAARLVAREAPTPARRRALALFVVQLAANALWTWLFFAWRLGAAAFVEIVALWMLIVLTIVAFRRVSRVAALLLAPYLAWVSFATALAWAMWRANPAVLG